MKSTFIYKVVDNCEIKGDFYPINEEQAPLIIYIHGGGLIWGGRSDMNKDQIKRYNQAGYNVCSIDYRLAPETKLPQIAEDIQDALIWLKEEGTKTYDFDTERIAIIGGSAGGYLALLAGTFKIKPKVIVSFYGYGDILGDWYTKPAAHFTNMTTVPESLAQQLIQNQTISNAPVERRFAIYLHYRQQGIWVNNVTGLHPASNTDTITTYCPLDNITSDYPATLLLHGDVDKDVPYEESVKMSDALSKFGVINQLITIPNGEHLFDQNMQDSNVINIFEQVIAFLNENL